MRRLLVGIACFLSAFPVTAEEFGPRFNEGYEHLRAGDPDAALESFRDLLTETPDSDLVQYSIASAQYQKGLQTMDVEGVEEGTKVLSTAQKAFDELRASNTEFVRQNAGFGAANCTAQLAKRMDEQVQYKERIQALQKAVNEYEQVLSEYPGHEGAQTNLNHTRYLLKRMLQNPPPEQKSEDGEGEDEGEQSQEQQQQEGSQGGQPPQGEEGEQDESQQEAQPQSDENAPSQEPQESAQDSKDLTDENIEAILQSLEEKNREEQKNLRRAKGAPRVRDGKWW